MTRFIIFRHGETNWNIEKRLCGKTNVPLNDNGRQQAEKLSKRLSKEKIDVIYSSGLSRAFETAKIATKSQNKEIIIKEELEEMSYGPLEGKTKEEVQQQYPRLERFNDEHLEKIGAERFGYWEKIFRTKIIPELYSKHTGKTVTLSTHGSKKKALLLGFGLKKDTILKERIKNCAVTIIEKTDKQTKVICYNDNSHVTDL